MRVAVFLMTLLLAATSVFAEVKTVTVNALSFTRPMRW
jgi:hypothetical protein